MSFVLCFLINICWDFFSGILIAVYEMRSWWFHCFLAEKKTKKKTIRIENSQEQIDKFLVNLSLISVLYYSFFLYSVNSVFRFKIYYYVFFLTAIKWDAQRTVGLIANFSSDFFFIQLLPLLSWKPLDNAFFY